MGKIRVEVVNPLDGSIPSDEEMLDAAKAAGWSDDPGTGHAIMLPGTNNRPGYEVCNPLPFAPPIGWEATPPIEELIRQRVRDEYQALKDDEEIDDIVDAEDFDVPDVDDVPLETLYEFMAMEPEVPQNKEVVVSREDRARDEAEFQELVERNRVLVKRRARIEYERRSRESDDYKSYLYGDEPSENVKKALQRQRDADID